MNHPYSSDVAAQTTTEQTEGHRPRPHPPRHCRCLTAQSTEGGSIPCPTRAGSCPRPSGRPGVLSHQQMLHAASVHGNWQGVLASCSWNCIAPLQICLLLPQWQWRLPAFRQLLPVRLCMLHHMHMVTRTRMYARHHQCTLALPVRTIYPDRSHTSKLG